MKSLALRTAAAFACALALASQAGEAKRVKKPARGDTMDHGPFATAAISDEQAYYAKGQWPAAKETANFAYKGIAIRLESGEPAAMCFDTDLMRIAFGWTGGFLELDNTMLGNLRGEVNPAIKGARKFATKMSPGWGANGNLKDPRAIPLGPLPKAAAHYRGLYLNGQQVILSYTVGEASILELPGAIGSGEALAFTRTFHIEKSAVPLSLVLCDVDGGAANTPSPIGDLLISGLEKVSLTLAAVASAPKGAALSNAGGRIVLTLPAITAPVTFKAFIWNGSAAGAAEFAVAAKGAAEKVADLPALCKGGPPRWKETITTQAVLGKETDAYTVDTFTLPDDNPWKAWMRTSGFDFLSDGRAALCTTDGDVWIVSELEEKPGTLAWKRYASGMYELMGLRVVDDVIYVTGRDQITRLHDLNKDGEADFYENFNNDRVSSPNYHAFAFGLESDSAGNFYYAICGHRAKEGLPHQGCMIRVSKDGSKMDVYAGGIRSPNGLGMGPGDILTYGDNQGNYIPASKVTRVRESGFYGYMTHHQQATKPADYERPIFWLPQSADNSSGGQTWVTSDRWGPYKEQMIHCSYGKAWVYLCCTEEINGKMQGGAVRIPLSFQSGVMRARFNPRDGQLYVCGTRGWQTSGAKDGCFHRVRYTGKPAHFPTAINVKPNGIALTFPTPLDPASAGDAANYGIEQWNYLYSPSYGSPEFSVVDPKKKGHDPVAVKSAKVSDDGKTVFLEIPGIQPVMQMHIKFKINSKDGTVIAQEVFNTINVVPGK